MSDGFVALYIFMLAAIAGHVIISRVPVILHTPLMSGSNFIHGIVLIGAMVVLGHADTTLEKAIGFVAVALGAGNAAGGYVVTERMLEMFKSSKKSDGTARRGCPAGISVAQLPAISGAGGGLRLRAGCGGAEN